MKAALFNKYSTELKIFNKNVPEIKDKEVLVRVSYSSFCGHDLAIISGMLKRNVSDEVVLGHEVSGIVEAVGRKVVDYLPGDRVVSLLTNSCGECDRCVLDQSHRCRSGQGIGHGRDGGFAEYISVSQNSLFKIQDGTGLKEACMLACPIGVIEDAFVKYQGQFKTAVVSGATGGLGVYGLQKCARMFERVIALTTHVSAESFLLQLGANDVVTYDPSEEFKFKEIVLALTEDEGADLFIDPVGSIQFSESVACVSQYGYIMLLGDIHGVPLNIHVGDMLFKDLQIICSTGTSRRGIALAERMMLAGEIKPVISKIIELKDLENIMTIIQESPPVGRILVDMTL